MHCRSFWVVCVGLSLAACAPKGSEVDPNTRVPQAGNGLEEQDWPKWFPCAVDVRVHPASRYVMEREALRLEARVELLDEFNEPTKDVGLMAVELRLLGPNGRIVQDEQGRQRGFRWSFDLTTKAEQQKYWDPIARAYVLPLKIEEPDDDLPNFRTVLSVTFDPAWPDKPTLPTGDRAQKAVEVRTDW